MSKVSIKSPFSCSLDPRHLELAPPAHKLVLSHRIFNLSQQEKGAPRMQRYMGIEGYGDLELHIPWDILHEYKPNQ